MEDIKDADYKQAKIIWEDIGIKNPGKDQDLLVLKPYIDLKIEQRTNMISMNISSN